MTSSCFNSNCGQVLKEEEDVKEGWLCRTGELANSTYKDGKFCETYHLNTSGWRCCESCGKQIHCGCIVSFHMFVLLDAGGIECLDCAKTEYILTPNPTWPSAHNLPGPAEKIRDISSKNWRSIAENPVTWRQAPNLSSASKAQPESPASHHPPGPAERIKDVTSRNWGSIDESTLRWRQTPNLSGASKPQPELQCSGPVPWRIAPSLFSASKAQPETQCRKPFDANIDKSLANEQWPCCSLGKSKTGDPSERLVTENRKAREIQYEWQRDLFKDVSSAEKGNVSGTNVQRPCLPPIVGKPCPNDNGAGPSLEAQAHSAKARGEIQILPQYCPRATDQELRQISGGSNAKITPLFEKQLSASDCARNGRLVLPKRCAEAHFPQITTSEGCHLVFQDMNGKDWVLHYRFWLNNNSRMYVLEGFAPFVRSMQLQAGDTVTFSRLEPEGKLVMGFRKVSLASPWDLGDETTSTSHSTHEESKDSILFKSRNSEGIWSEADNIPIPAKRMKVDNTCADNKHLNNEQEILQISVTLEQVQELLQPPLTNSPTVVVIEGFEFEDFQEAPIIGTPKNCSANHVGSLRSKEVEPTPEHLEQILPLINNAAPSKKTASEDPGRGMNIEGVGGYPDLASSQATIRHPSHKYGCTCIVCVQPPSGTKHKSTCTCNVCLAFKRSFPPSVIPHDQKRLENQVGCSVENTSQKSLYADVIRHYQMGLSNQNQKVAGGSGRFENDPFKDKSPASSFKSQNIDLNIQPEREEEFHPVSDSMGIMRLVQESTQRYMRQQKRSINGVADGNHAL
ncbi:B3 domain-containing protein-like protein [Tanacetum coccineum]